MTAGRRRRRRSSSRRPLLLPLQLLLLAPPLPVLVPLLPSLPGAAAQFPTTVPNLTTIASPADPAVKISYKRPSGACTTAFDTQEQYTGWVRIPGAAYTDNLFFWFVGAREPTSALTIWLNGGPGASSMFGFFTETGPCEVVVAGTEGAAAGGSGPGPGPGAAFASAGADRLTTVAREWGWDRASNMLFVDQPTQAGFSYDRPTHGSLDLLTNKIYTPPQTRPRSRPPAVFLNGTFSSQAVNGTANTTDTAAVAVWHLLQAFLATFPRYRPADNASVGVSLFAESYGGRFGPVFASRWEDMNKRRANGSLDRNTTLDIRLTALGIVNGCVDDLIQAPYYPVMAINDSYGLSAINSLRAQMANASFYAPGGCQDLIRQCRSAVRARDPANTGADAGVNEICRTSYLSCTENVMLPYADARRSFYDIAAFLPHSFPPSRYLSYVNSEAFQSAIGTELNYTQTSDAVSAAFAATGDPEREAMVPRLAALLDAGVRVGFMYGDRDYICNWLGGEAVSLSVAAAATTAAYAGFGRAGYAPIQVNDSYVGGVVRQLGNLSFSRIYQAGHFVPAYQPETAFQVFARILLGTAVADGTPLDPAAYRTAGSANATARLPLPASPANTCWLRSVPETCGEEQQRMLLEGNGTILHGALVVGHDGTQPSPTTTVYVTSPATTTEILTGLFTATAAPSSLATSSLDMPTVGALALGGLLCVVALVV